MNAPEKLSSSFVTLSRVDVSNCIEKKGQFSYLSWAFAVSQLRQVEPTATWEVLRFNGLPYLQTELGYFVEVSVTVQGITLSQIHPVLDARNKPIAKPTAFEINTSIQRCLVKAIALHGLGLQLYAGEDLPLIVEDHSAEDSAMLAKYREAALSGLESLKKFHAEIPASASKDRVYQEHRAALAKAAQQADQGVAA